MTSDLISKASYRRQEWCIPSYGENKENDIINNILASIHNKLIQTCNGKKNRNKNLVDQPVISDLHSNYNFIANEKEDTKEPKALVQYRQQNFIDYELLTQM